MSFFRSTTLGMILQARISFVPLSWRVVLATPLAWLILAITLWAHGAWLGTGVINLTPASRSQLKTNVQNGDPALQNGDVIEVFSSFPAIVAGTIDGPGGYATMYVPDGTEVVGAYITDAAGNALPARPAQATTGSGVSKGWGPKGQLTFDVSANGWQPESNNECSLAGFSIADCNAGLAYIYGDTGIFYSTRSDTALFANGDKVASLTNGYLVNPTNGTPWTSVGGSGTARVHNKWDAVQINAFGSGGNIDPNGFTIQEETTITGGRGATPFRSGSPVAGPESGSDWDRYGTTGPWNRIQYAGSCKADDPSPTLPGQEGPATGAGSVSPETTDPGVNSVEVCTEVPTSGFDLNASDATALPPGTNAVRFAFGGIAQGEVFYAALRLRVLDINALGPVNAEGHGGDSAEGGAAGNDNPWRYWVAGSSVYALPSPDDISVGISIVEVNGAPYTGGDIPPYATLRYSVSYANTALAPLTNASVQVNLPSQTTGTSNFSVVTGSDIRPAVDPTGGTFSFNTIPSMTGLQSGTIEFDVTTNASASDVVTADAQITSDESGPANASIAVSVFNEPVETMPSCNGTRASAVDWATDSPTLLGGPSAFSNNGLSGTITATDQSQPLRPAAINTTSTLYAGDGGNPMLDAQYVDLQVSFDVPLTGIYLYVADLNQDESVTVYGMLNGLVVSPGITNGAGSLNMARAANADGSVTGERTNALGSGSQRAVTIGFNLPIDTLVIRHTPLQLSAPGLSGADGMHLGDILTCIDFTDAPSTMGDALHNFIDSDAIRLGATETGDTSPGNAANADSDEDDGMDIPLMTQGFITVVTADVTGSDGVLHGWIDFNGNGVFESGVAEHVAMSLADDGTGDDVAAGDGQIQFNVNVPGDAVLDQTFARFRWSTTPQLGPSGFASDGEVEDYALTIAAAPLVDRGDAPASYGDPLHIIADAGPTGVYLGAIVPDPEAVPQASADATGDDLDGNDDEDGVILPQLYQGAASELTVTVNEVTGGVGFGVAYLQAWVDFDGNGIFDTTDMIAADLQDGAAGDKDGVLNGKIVFDVNVPANSTLLPTFARFRWSTTAGVGIVALDGEVEDYSLTISGDSAPITCDAGLYQISTNKSVLKRMVFTTGLTGYTLNLQDIGSAGTDLDGGWGYNELDGYIYGVKSGRKELWRVDGSGTFTRLPDPPSTIEKGGIAGDVLPNGVMVYLANNDEFQLLDLSDPNNTIDNGLLVLATPVDTTDFAFNPLDGNLYGIDGTTAQVFRVTANNGSASVGSEAVTFFGPSYYTSSYGAAWFDENGLFYIYDDITNEVFLVDIATGVRQRIAVSQNDEGGDNDGASCRGPSVIQFGTISGNVYIDQNASDEKDGAEINLGGGIAISVYDDAGTPNDLADDQFIKTVDTFADGTYQVSNLSPGSTYRVEVDVNDTDLPAGSQIGTSNPIVGVTVVANGDTSDQNFGFDPQLSDLSLVKVAYASGTNTVITTASPGDVIDWVITVNNSGPGSPSNVTVIEKLPSGFQYLTDDAPATGDYYDPDTGVWFVDEILPGTSETLTIRARVEETGVHVNTVEIIKSSLPDLDSDPNTGARVDDFNDGIADDDEDSYEILLSTGERTLSGRLFVDNGIDGGIAHDGIANGGENGTTNAVMVILSDNNTIIAQPKISSDGTWSYGLSADYSGRITLRLDPFAAWLPISESKSGLPSLVDTDVHDGTYSFVPAADTDYPDLNFGVVKAPTMTLDQSAEIQAGQVAVLAHQYVATTTGTVLFTLGDATQTPAGAYSAAIFSDPNCDGAPDAAINSSTPVISGELICIVSRVSAGAGAGPGSSFIYALNATTSFDGTPVTHVAANIDRVTSGAASGVLTLSKTVKNVTANSAEGTSNLGTAGDVLAYRIQIENKSSAAASDVIIYDRTPPYTSLSEPVETPVSVGAALSCALTIPASNTIGYAGPLQWNCLGSYPPGSIGSVSFNVKIEP